MCYVKNVFLFFGGGKCVMPKTRLLLPLVFFVFFCVFLLWHVKNTCFCVSFLFSLSLFFFFVVDVLCQTHVFGLFFVYKEVKKTRIMKKQGLQIARFDTTSQWVPGQATTKQGTFSKFRVFFWNFPKFSENVRKFRDFPGNFRNFGIFRNISGVSGFSCKFPEFRDFPEHFRNFKAPPENSGISSFP